MLVRGGKLDVKSKQDPCHQCSPGAIRHWRWARLAWQASRRRWAQGRDRNNAVQVSRSDSCSLKREDFAVRHRAALSEEGENHSARDGSFKETLTAFFKPQEPTFYREDHLPARFHTQIPIVGTYVVTPGSRRADRKAD